MFADYGIISFPPSRVTPTGACQLVSQFGRFGRFGPFGQMESLIWSSGKKSGKIVHQTALSVANSTVGRLNIFAVLVFRKKVWKNRTSDGDQNYRIACTFSDFRIIMWAANKLT